MKTLCFILILVFFVAGNNIANGQQQHDQHEPGFCGTHQWLENRFKASPELRIEYDNMEKRLGRAVKEKLQRSGNRLMNQSSPSAIMEEFGVVYIPVVFHIVGTNPSSITDAQIYAQLDTLNKDFGGNNGDSVKILPGFKPYFGKSNIRFCLAQRTPNGQPSNGIMRYASTTVSTGSSSATDPIKSTTSGGASAWDPNRYLNVWIGSFTVSGLLGYASFPISSPENSSNLLSQQGLVIEKGTVPGGGIAEYNTGRVLTHEVGHYFWLRHIWGDTNCGNDFPNTPGIDDTPTVLGPSSGCYSGIIPTGCSSEPNGRMYQNYMDYSNSTCMAMFSTGQTIRMAICLDSFRTSLKSSNGCEPVSCPNFGISLNYPGTSQVSFSVSGGLPPYVYSLDSIYFQQGNQFSGLTPGNTYMVYIKDATFCTNKKTFILPGISLAPLSKFYCVGEDVAVNYTIKGFFDVGNQFKAQLSDSAGNFDHPIDLGILNSSSSGTINTTIPAIATGGLQYKIRVVSSNPAIISTDPDAFFEIAKTTVPAGVSIAMLPGDHYECIGSPVSFKATATNGGTNPIFQWKRNGTDIATGDVFSSSSLANNDEISCIMTSNSTCVIGNTASSNILKLALVNSRNALISITSNAPDTICAATKVIFKAAVVNGGSAPQYQWKINGNNVGTNSDTFSISNLLSTDIVYCLLNSSIPCAAPNIASNNLSFFVAPSGLPSVSISSDIGTGFCAGKKATFTAVPVNGGDHPFFEWIKNGVTVGSSTTTYTDSTLKTGDVIYCWVTSSASCVEPIAASSNALTISLITTPAPTISINAPGGNQVCNDGVVTFSANVFNVGTTVLLQWQKNGLNVGVGNTYTPTNLLAGDTIVCKLTAVNSCQVTSEYVSNLMIIEKANVTTPLITGSTTISCGETAILRGSATSPDNAIDWYTAPAGGLPIGRGDSIVVKPAATTTFYGQATAKPNRERQVVSIDTTGAVFINHDDITGDDQCGIAIGRNYVYYTGELYTGKFSKDLTSSKESLPLRNGFFCDLFNGDIWQLGNATSNGSSFVSGEITRLYKLDENLHPTGSYLPLSKTISISSSAGFVASGHGFVILYSYSTCAKIDLKTGIVTTINGPVWYAYTRRESEGWAEYGWAEFDGIDYYVCYVTLNFTIVRRNMRSGVESIIQAFRDIGDMANIIFDPYNSRMYYEHEGTNQLSGPGRVIGYVPVTTNYSTACASERIPVTVNVTTEAVTPSVVITSNLTNPICAAARVTFSATAVNGGAIPTYQWRRNGMVEGTGQTYTPINYYDRDIITCHLVSSLSCVTSPVAHSNSIQLSVLPPSSYPGITIIPDVPWPICYGKSITLTADTSNAGLTQQYQWTKNEIVVGDNSRVYTEVVSGEGRLVCRMITTSHCSTITSAYYDLFPTPSVHPSISIASSLDTSICKAEFVTLTSTSENAGTNPVYRWKKNCVVADTGSVYITNSLNTADTLICELTSSAACATPKTVVSNQLIFTVTDLPIADTIENTTVCPGSVLPGINFTGTGAEYRWTNNNTAIGLPAKGIGNIPSFIASNNGPGTLTATISAVPFSTSKEYAYITNSDSNTISVLDVETNQIASTITTIYSPTSILAAPDGRWVYVSGNGNSVFNTTNNKSQTKIGSGSGFSGMCLSPDATRLYGGNAAFQRVDVYDTKTNQYQGTYSLGSSNSVRDITLTKDGSKLYAISSTKVFPITTSTGIVGPSIQTGGINSSLAISNDGSRLFVANTTYNNVAVINTVTNSVVSTIPVGKTPLAVILANGDSTLYVANYRDSSVSVINVATLAVIKSIRVGSGPSGMSFNEHGTHLYVTNKTSNTVSVISTTNNSVIQTIGGFRGPSSYGSFIVRMPRCSGSPISFTINVSAPNWNRWTGMANTDWYNPANWICGRIPTAKDNVVIAVSPLNHYPIIPANNFITIRSIKLEPGTSTKLGANSSFILTGSY